MTLTANREYKDTVFKMVFSIYTQFINSFGWIKQNICRSTLFIRCSQWFYIRINYINFIYRIN